MEFFRSLTGARIPPAAAAAMDHNEELIAEVDEPPDELRWHKTKALSQPNSRRESLLTRQLHSEAEHSEEEPMPPPKRALSTQSTWSTHSTTSTAELTSDDGRSMPSPAVSPPLNATAMRNALPIMEKPLDKKIAIVQHEALPLAHEKKDDGRNASVESGLGRKRCITFACGNKAPAKAPSPPPPTSEPEQVVTPSPPKRKCALKFVCPSRSGSESKPAPAVKPKRAASPPPPERKSPSKAPTPKAHRGSDSTVTHGSPRSFRKTPIIQTTAPTPKEEKPNPIRRLSAGSDESDSQATRFHEFATSDSEPEDWVQEATCYRQRLTINDTLKKENVIRLACEEAEEEAVEDEDEDEDEDGEVDETAFDDEDDQEEDDLDEDEDEDSDEGFHSDDEEGFAESDSEDDGEGSDYEWWKPGGKSTAATSVEHLDRMTLTHNSENTLASSVGSVSSAGRTSPRLSKQHFESLRKDRHPRAVKIEQPEPAELPDSTDFVCGTLDEDRPLEQAYIKCMKDREAAKHKARPQDIDPSFPTSNPELDEEDDEDLENNDDSDNDFLHGDLDELDGGSTLKRRTSMRRSRKSSIHRSPPPPNRGRMASPPPSKKKQQYRSPPPPTKRGTARSPPPSTKRPARSPAPVKRTARSPAPRKLFNGSPRRARSPPPNFHFTSPPNTRRPSPAGRTNSTTNLPLGLAGRPQPTHTASLPRGGGHLMSRMTAMNNMVSDHEGSDTAGNDGPTAEIPKRGAIDIVKGLEKKRQRRKEKLYQKLCAKAAAKGEKPYKVKPGRGAERMREVGLELQRYRGTGAGEAEHILSV